jgi:hypothetical protein
MFHVPGLLGSLTAHPEALRRITMGQLVERYKDTISPRKRSEERGSHVNQEEQVSHEAA